MTASPALFAGLEEAVGETPLVELRSLTPKPGVRLFAKLEDRNPTGSVKDRIVRRILLRAREEGRLAPGQRIVEASTGNTGIALAMLGRRLGHPVGVCVPESVYPEIGGLLRVYGADIHWVSGEGGIKAAREAAQRLVSETGAYFLDQFGSTENVAAHYEGTGTEILRDLNRVDVFIAGIGTGGTVSGAGRRLKEANPACKVIGVEPRLGFHVQGLKSLQDGFIPPVLDDALLDGKILVGSRHAFSHARRALLAEGVFGGISSGAVLHAAMRVAGRLDRGNIVMVFADAGWKYLSTNIWRDERESDEPSPPEDPLDDVLWW